MNILWFIVSRSNIFSYQCNYRYKWLW